MGDLSGLLASLNLSPVNTILLAVLLFVLKWMHQRLQTVEQLALGNEKSLAFIKGKLDIHEEE